MWWIFRLTALLTAVYLVTIVTATPACTKSFPSGTTTSDETLLMKVFYLADPDFDTARIYYNGYRSLGYFDWKNWHYSNTWLPKLHDGKQSLITLWQYLANCVVTKPQDLYTHYKYIYDKVDWPANPNGVINFKILKNKFSEACTNFHAFKNTWPFSCVDDKFFCSFAEVFPLVDDMVLETKWEEIPGTGSFKAITSLVSSKQLYAWSDRAVDGYNRESILDALFHENILKYIPQTIQGNVFYMSKLAYLPIKTILDEKVKSSLQSDNGYYFLKEYLDKKCTEKANTPVGREYYCRANSLVKLLDECLKLADPTPCLYDPTIQVYFARGYFYYSLKDDMVKKTTEIITSIKVNTNAGKINFLKSMVEAYSTYVTVQDSECTFDWKKGYAYERTCDTILCHAVTLYRFDCVLKFVLKQMKPLIDLTNNGLVWTDVKVKRAKDNLLIWLSYIPLAEFASFTNAENSDIILSTQKTIQELTRRLDASGLTHYSKHWPSVTFVPASMKKKACLAQTTQQAHVIYCAIETLLHSVFLFVSVIADSKTTTIRSLNPTIDYKILIEQLQLDRIKGFIVMQTESYFNEIDTKIQQNFGKLSDYFSSMANFDTKKAEADIAYIAGRLETFNTKISSISKKVEELFSTTLKFAIAGNVVELVQKAVQLGVAIAKQAHPGSQILGGGDPVGVMEAVNELAQAGVTSAKLGRIGTQDFPILIEMGVKLGKGFKNNTAQQKVVKQLISGLKSKTGEIEDVATIFLDKYNKYSPQVLKSDITEYGDKWKTVSVAVCEAAFDGTTAASALAEIGLAGKGDCIKISSKIAQLITVYEELYDYQSDLMNSLSAATRAYLSGHKANQMKSVYSSGPTVDKPFLRKMAVNTFLVSTMHVWQILIEYCDVLTYTSGGTVPSPCTAALEAPSYTAVARVLAHSPPEACRTNTEFGQYLDIPIKPQNEKDTGYIDLEKLYTGEEVTFQIPDFQWLKDHKWIGAQEVERTLFVKGFELILPPMSMSSQYTVEILVKPSNVNYLRKAGTKYLLPLAGLSTVYISNKFNCYSTNVYNPYALCKPTDLSKICYVSRGTENGHLMPSITTKWTIKAVNIPLNEKAPKPATDFQLQAGITYCRTELRKKKRDVLSLGPRDRPRREAEHCCVADTYWNGMSCSACPSGSKQKLKGYYCE